MPCLILEWNLWNMLRSSIGFKNLFTTLMIWCKFRLILSGKVTLGRSSLPKHTWVKEAKLHPQTLMGKAKWISVISLCVVSQLSGSSDGRSTRRLQCFADRLLHFYIWLRFPLLTLGRIKSQTFCNCPWDWTGHFHHGKKLKRNKWHILVYGNDICGVQRQPAWSPSNFKMRDFSVCMSLY